MEEDETGDEPQCGVVSDNEIDKPFLETHDGGILWDFEEGCETRWEGRQEIEIEGFLFSISKFTIPLCRGGEIEGEEFDGLRRCGSVVLDLRDDELGLVEGDLAAVDKSMTKSQWMM